MQMMVFSISWLATGPRHMRTHGKKRGSNGTGAPASQGDKRLQLVTFKYEIQIFCTGSCKNPSIFSQGSVNQQAGNTLHSETWFILCKG